MNVKIPFIKFLKENGIFSNELEYIMNYYKYNNQLNMKQFINQKLKEISPYFLSNNFFKNFVKNDDKKIISNLLKIFNIYHRNLKQIKFSYLYKWLIKANKIKINNNNNNSNKIKSKSQRNILFHKNIKQLNLNTDRLYEDYKFKELYLNNMNVLNQFTEGNKCTFQPYINNNNNNYYINTLIKNKNNNNENFRFNSVNNIRKHTNNNNYSIDKLNNNNSIETFSDYNQTISNYNNNKNYNNKYKKRIYNTITNNNYNDDIYKNNIKHNNLIFKNYSKYNLSKNSNYIDEKKKSKLNFSLNDYIYYNKFYDLINKMTIYPKFNNYNNNINNNRKNENKGFLTSRISKKKLSNISFNIKDSILNDNNFPPEEFKFKLNKKIKSEKKILNTHNNNNNKINKNINYEGTEDSMNLQTTKIKNTIGPFNLGTNSNSSFQNNTTNTMYNNNINYNNNNNYNSHNKKNYLIYEKNLDSIKSKISNTSNYTYSKDENSLEIFDNNKNIKISYNNNNNNNYINNNDNDNNNNNKYFNNIYNQISNEHFNINNNIYQDHNKKFTETSSNLEVSATYPKVTSINFYEENEKKMFKQADNMLKASDDNYSINKFLDSYNKFKK